MVASVVKRAGHSEPYDRSKLHQSIRWACLSVRALEGEAELFARKVSGLIDEWISDKAEVTSRELHVRTANYLHILHADAAYAYAVHDNAL